MKTTRCLAQDERKQNKEECEDMKRGTEGDSRRKNREYK